MRHATFNAIACLARFKLPDHYVRSTEYTHACDWSRTVGWQDQVYNRGIFTSDDALVMMAGRPPILPTCPTCAIFVDMALEAGNAIEQELILKLEDEQRREKANEQTVQGRATPGASEESRLESTKAEN